MKYFDGCSTTLEYVRQHREPDGLTSRGEDKAAGLAREGVMTTRYVTTLCRAFASEPAPHEHTIAVCPDGWLRVWDSVAQYYTIVHSIDGETQEKIRRFAATLPEWQIHGELKSSSKGSQP
jgi:hypothetical protein